MILYPVHPLHIGTSKIVIDVRNMNLDFLRVCQI